MISPFFIKHYVSHANQSLGSNHNKVNHVEK